MELDALLRREQACQMTADLKRVQDALDTLSEHFDTVQIFATRHEPEIEDRTLDRAESLNRRRVRHSSGANRAKRNDCSGNDPDR